MSAPDLHSIVRAAGIVDPFSVQPVGAVVPVAQRELYGRILNAISAADTAGYNRGWAARNAQPTAPEDRPEISDDRLLQVYLRGAQRAIEAIPDVTPSIVELAMDRITDRVPEPEGLRAIYNLSTTEETI